MPKNPEPTREAVLAALPGWGSKVARETGLGEATVSRTLTWLVERNLAHQSGWRKASRYVPVYKPGPAPEGFKLRPMPKGATKKERDAKHQTRKNVKARQTRLKQKAWRILIQSQLGGSSEPNP